MCFVKLSLLHFSESPFYLLILAHSLLIFSSLSLGPSEVPLPHLRLCEIIILYQEITDTM